MPAGMSDWSRGSFLPWWRDAPYGCRIVCQWGAVKCGSFRHFAGGSSGVDRIAQAGNACEDDLLRALSGVRIARSWNQSTDRG